MYRNGNQVGQTTGLGMSINYSAFGSQSFALMADAASGGGSFFEGKLHKVAVYERAWTRAQVADEFCDPFAVLRPKRLVRKSFKAGVGDPPAPSVTPQLALMGVGV